VPRCAARSAARQETAKFTADRREPRRGMPGAVCLVMRRKKPMKAPFVITVSAAAAAVSILAGCNGLVEGRSITNPPDPPSCSEDDSCPPGFVADHTNPPAPARPACPESEPKEGLSCSGQISTCRYDDLCESRPSAASATRDYRCIGSTWTRESASYVAACPASPPNPGESCAACALQLPAQCNYAGGTDPSCPGAVAFCDPKTLTWSLSISSCNPPPPDNDAGAGP
jgi:hypothetical protein